MFYQTWELEDEMDPHKSLESSGSDVLEEPTNEWATSWQIPVVSALGIAVFMIPIYSLGALMPSIHAATGWTWTQISSGPIIMSIAGVLLSPVVGGAIDRFGSRKIVLPALLLFCMSIASLSLTGPSIFSWWAVWVLVAICDVFVSVIVWTAAVVTRFDRDRGMAIGIALAGTGIGSFCLPFITTILQEHFGWRSAIAILPLGGLVLVYPFVWRYFHNSTSTRRSAPQASAFGNEPSGITFLEAFLSRRYLQMASACLLAAVGSAGLAVHFVPILRSGGLSAHQAAATAAAIGIAVITGRLTGGFLLDRYSGPMIGLISCALPVVACPILLVDHSVGAGLFAAIMLGLSTGSEIGVLAYLVPRYFGLRHFGLLFAVISGLQTLGVGLGPLLAGYIFDRFGTYNNLLILDVPLFAASAVLLGTLGTPAESQR